jgi:hypothetical protein
MPAATRGPNLGGQAGVTDVAEGAQMLEAANDVEVMSAIVGTLSDCRRAAPRGGVIRGRSD